MTLLVKKFDYASISRKQVNGKRLYLTPDGNAVASVTTILNRTKDNTYLFEWRKRVGEQKAQEITTEAAGVGTRMHKYLEDYIDTGEWPKEGSNPYAAKANQMAYIIKEKAFCFIDEIIGSEINLWMPNLYAGTTDLVCTYKGNLCICDFKQTNKPKKQEWVDDYYLQLVAYIEAHNELYKTSINEGHIFMCSRDLQYQQFDLLPKDYSYWKNEWYNRLYAYYESHSH